MRNICKRFAVLCMLALCSSIWGQAVDGFDIATFVAPKGWTRQASDSSVRFSKQDKDSFCLMTLFKSLPAVGTASQDFKAAWLTIVPDSVDPQGPPQMLPSDKKDSWIVTSGYAPFEKDGAKGVAVLVTLSGHGKMVIFMILTNTSDYEAETTAFMASVKLKAPAAAAAVNSADNSAIVGQWGVNASPQDSYSVNNGINGYTKREYTFYPNGTYQFLTKLFSYTSSQLLFTKETGTYKLSGSSLTVIPQKGSIQAWTKATVTGGDGRQSQTDNWGKLVNNQPWPLETATYEISKNYLAGIQKWQLMMRSTKPTKRDGPFNGGSAFPNTWFYETVSFPIDPPR